MIAVRERNPFVILPEAPPEVPAGGRRAGASPLVPQIPLEDGEQYRFHFDMSKCIGCKCCEVACNEQNHNPPDVSWRRVGEVEGGVYPYTSRLHLSMGCNHCLDPACMRGCPTGAYTKDARTGIVQHNADICIGCEYCLWNCPYSVPVFNEERGVVGKCDMCYGRLETGDAPACVNACPSEAITIEKVNVATWREEYAGEANAPGMPSAADTISTTRITLPDNLPLDAEKADYHRVRPEKPHWSLVAMTVVTQLSVGAVASAWLLGWLGSGEVRFAATLALALGLASFGVSPLHLGRPALAPLAVRNWRTSWLSREVLGLSGFGAATFAYAASLWLNAGGSAAAGALAGLIGIGGVYASARIYLVPGRPSWNSPHTIAEFFLTSAVLGPLLVAAIGAGSALLSLAAGAAVLQLLNQVAKFVGLIRSEEFEKQASARLLSNELAQRFLARLVLLVFGGAVLPLAGYPAAGFVLALAGELLGRYLFFVSVVPKNMAMTFFAGGREAA